MRGQYAQGLQGRDNSIEVFQQQGPFFVLLVIITSFFPSSISYMTSGIHGRPGVEMAGLGVWGRGGAGVGDCPSREGIGHG